MAPRSRVRARRPVRCGARGAERTVDEDSSCPPRPPAGPGRRRRCSWRRPSLSRRARRVAADHFRPSWRVSPKTRLGPLRSWATSPRPRERRDLADARRAPGTGRRRAPPRRRSPRAPVEPAPTGRRRAAGSAAAGGRRDAAAAACRRRPPRSVAVDADGAPTGDLLDDVDRQPVRELGRDLDALDAPGTARRRLRRSPLTDVERRHRPRGRDQRLADLGRRRARGAGHAGRGWTATSEESRSHSQPPPRSRSASRTSNAARARGARARRGRAAAEVRLGRRGGAQAAKRRSLPSPAPPVARERTGRAPGPRARARSPKRSVTRRRPSAISAITSAVVASPWFSTKLACLSEKRAPPIRSPRQPAASSSWPGGAALGARIVGVLEGRAERLDPRRLGRLAAARASRRASP